MDTNEEEEVIIDPINDEVEEEAEEVVEPKKSTENLEAKRARLEGQLARVNRDLGIVPEKNSSRSDGLDYGEKAFLVANGIIGEETKLVQEAIKRTGESLEQILENPYFQAKLKETRDLAMTAQATPKGARSNSVPTDSVEYWATQPIEDVPQNIRIKVVNHKLKQGVSNGQFYNS